MSNRSRFLPTLSTNLQVTAESAFIDRFQLEIGDWAIFGPETSICSALTAFSQSNVLTAHGEVVPLFNGHIVDSLYAMRKLKFTTNPNNDNISRAAALISGAVRQAQWRFSETSKQPGESARVEFSTQLNLTRFIQAQHLKKRSPLHRPNLAASYVLAIDPDEDWYSDEIPLLPATNLIIGPAQKYAYALKRTRSAQFSRYLNLVKGMLNRVLADAFDGEEATFQRFPAYALKEIEFYWEFDSSNPIDYVQSIRPSIMAGHDNVSEDVYAFEQASFNIQGQSPCLTVRITRDTKIKIYAKTNRRVRFEVTLKNDAINRAAKKGISSPTAGRRTSATSRALVEMVPLLAEEAAQRTNSVLQSIATSPVAKSSFTALQFVHAIAQACETPHESETVIAALTTFGRISLQNNDPLRDIVHTLRDRGILRNTKPRSKVYVVTEKYREPLGRLRQFR